MWPPICSILFPILQKKKDFHIYSLKPHFQQMTLIRKKKFLFLWIWNENWPPARKVSLAFCLFLVLLSAYCFHFFHFLLLIKCHIYFNNSTWKIALDEHLKSALWVVLRLHMHFKKSLPITMLSVISFHSYTMWCLVVGWQAVLGWWLKW